jgi:prepilin peptidase CpaA
MFDAQSIAESIAENWLVWMVTVTLIVAAVIDGWLLKVPNWLTFPFIIGGIAYHTAVAGWGGLGWSLLGFVVGLLLLMPLHCIGGMGAGDVKLLAGVGAWVGATVTFYAFCWTSIIGAVLAVLMVLASRSWDKHQAQFWLIAREILTVKDPNKLSAIAAERKPSMRLLPYGIPIAIGTILHFAWTGMLL